MRHLDLFSGIGGFALAAQSVWQDDYQPIAFCDNEPFCQAVLKKHWPDTPIYEDIKTLDTTKLGPVDLVTGGFPCQPFSSAGKRRGTEDDRYLWPEMLRVIREAAPRWVIGENVGGLVSWNGGLVLDQVFADLEAEGYEVWAFVIPAVAVNAPHRRDRIWIIAHTRHGARRSQQEQQQEERAEVDAGSNGSRNPASTNTEISRRKRPEQSTQHGRHRSFILNWQEPWPQAAARLCTLDDGLPGGLARPRRWRNAALKAAGNAIVPQVAARIMTGIASISENGSN